MAIAKKLCPFCGKRPVPTKNQRGCDRCRWLWNQADGLPQLTALAFGGQAAFGAKEAPPEPVTWKVFDRWMEARCVRAEGTVLPVTVLWEDFARSMKGASKTGYTRHAFLRWLRARGVGIVKRSVRHARGLALRRDTADWMIRDDMPPRAVRADPWGGEAVDITPGVPEDAA
jgi:hypothetical protein